jgi:hypothetical protein
MEPYLFAGLWVYGRRMMRSPGWHLAPGHVARSALTVPLAPVPLVDVPGGGAARASGLAGPSRPATTLRGPPSPKVAIPGDGNLSPGLATLAGESLQMRSSHRLSLQPRGGIGGRSGGWWSNSSEQQSGPVARTRYHPDRPGPLHDDMNRLNGARCGGRCDS